MSLLKKREFMFTWQIHNFSMCPHQSQQHISSPPFVVEVLKKSEWQLKLFPKGLTENSTLSCLIICNNVVEFGNSDAIKTDFSFALFYGGSEKRFWRKEKNVVFKKGVAWEINFDSRADIFGDAAARVPNDTLTVQCTMWRSDDSSDDEEFPTGFEDSQQCDECRVITRVQVQRRNVFWPILNFSSIGFSKVLTIRVPSALADYPSFRITLCKSITLESVAISIRCENIGSSKSVLVKCKAAVLTDTPKDVEYFAEDVHLFDSQTSQSNTWNFPSFINLGKLREDKVLDGTCDLLHLRFEFSFSRYQDLHHTEKDSFHQYGTFVKFADPIELPDVTIRTGDDNEFKMHKSVLKVRSPVFGAMFEAADVAVVSDVDSETIDQMLFFMYTNELEDLQFEGALKLYLAAVKYKVLSLKVRCSWILASTISVSNVCEVLTLADQNGDEYLVDSAKSFACSNSMEILKSQEWQDFIKNNAAVAAQVMFSMLTN